MPETSIKVVFIGENGTFATGKVLKFSVCGVVIEPAQNYRHINISDKGNIVVNVAGPDSTAVACAWGEVGEYSDSVMELYFRSVDEQSYQLIHRAATLLRKGKTRDAA